MITIMMEKIFHDLDGTRVLSLVKGETLFRRGAPTHAIYQVRRGRVAMVRQLADGALVTILTAGPSESFAEAAMFTERYHCDAVACTDCELLFIPTLAIREMLERAPERAIMLASFFAGQVRDLRQRVELLRIKRAPDRLLTWLRSQARGDPPTVTPSEAWASTASEIGLTPEALYRALRKLEHAGVIVRTARRVILTSVEFTPA